MSAREPHAAPAHDSRLEEQAYAECIRSERPGPLRRRRQMKWVREFEAKYGPSERLRGLVTP